MEQSFFKTAGAVETNARMRWIPDESGEYKPYELLCFSRPVFVPDGWERVGMKQKKSVVDDLIIDAEAVGNQAENRRKSYTRAKNKLFDLLMCTTSFDSFVTLTLSGNSVNRYDYKEIVGKLGVWLDNRVRRNDLTYALVPELHKDGAIHFHGLVNMDGLKVERARYQNSGRLIYDSCKRPIFNVSDFPYGFSTCVPLSGDNARQATAKYCYKYITKSHGEKVGGRYYLSGGNLGRPRYTYLNVDFDALDETPIKVGGGAAMVKKRRYNSSQEGVSMSI